MRSTADITGFHAHVYFGGATREKAARLRDGVAARFAVEIGQWHDGPIGPHPEPMYQIAFASDQLGPLVAWLMLNREGLRVLVHPLTGDEVADHTERPLWLGEPLPLDVELLRRHVARREAAPAR